MPNYVATNLYKGLQSAAVTSVALPTIGSGGIIIETESNTIAGVAALSKVIIPASGLNKKERVYYSALTVAALVTALGVGYVTLSVFRSEQSSAAGNVAFPANGSTGIVVEAVTGLTIGTTTILSQIIVPGSGLNQKAKIYYSASTVAAIVTALG